MGKLDFSVASHAFWLIAIKLKPGGIMYPFCDPEATTSNCHSSTGTLQAPRLVTQSTIDNALLCSRMYELIVSKSLITPVEVSEWVKITAFISFSLSPSNTSLNSSGLSGVPQGESIFITSNPNSLATFTHLSPNFPFSPYYFISFT